ncbi:MAG: hypothetical protein DRJ09_00700 [Bacteroidetes bacterium]|nr:MAG: hypothetical protein DRJ09_00700 [Bacteroidota bacterium]
MKTLQHIILIAIFLLPSALFAGGNLFPLGARNAGICRSSTALTGFWNILNNQAGLATLKNPAAGISYESKFSLNQLSNKTVAIAYPTGAGVLGIDFNHFGYQQYNEMKVGLVYARAFGKYLRIGLQLDYLQTTLGQGYGSKKNITFELGVQSDISNEVTLGAYVYNPIRVKFSDYADERVPAIIRFGLTWHFSESFLATVEAEKSSFYPKVIIRGGLEYSLKKKFFMRTGFSSGEEVFAIGFGIHIKRMQFDIAAIMHQTLGFSPQASLSYAF